jgi:hypothetical protein
MKRTLLFKSPKKATMLQVKKMSSAFSDTNSLSRTSSFSSDMHYLDARDNDTHDVILDHPGMKSSH